MLTYILVLFLAFLLRYLWINRFIFNTDLTRNYSDNHVPLYKSGFAVALKDEGEFGKN